MNDSTGERRPVSVLGATGTVGQRLVALLARHPAFELTAVAASEKSAGRAYGETVEWRLPGGPPESSRGLVVAPCRPESVPGSIVFSALDAAVARDVEAAFARDGRAVVSNARSYRADPDVPLVVPEINGDHLDLIAAQRAARGWSGFIVTNPNCAVIGLSLALAPLHRAAGVRRAVVTTMQAVSGAGYPGVPALDIVDNVVPGIPGEEPKIAGEPCKILGTLAGTRIEPASLIVSAHAHRVPVVDGHLMSVSLETSRPMAPEEAAALLGSFRGEPQERRLPSAPERPIVVLGDACRPQPRFDRDRGGGMSVSVGRVRDCPALGLAFEVLVHNTVRGAAGGTLLLGELIADRGLLP